MQVRHNKRAVLRFRRHKWQKRAKARQFTSAHERQTCIMQMVCYNEVSTNLFTLWSRNFPAPHPRPPTCTACAFRCCTAGWLEGTSQQKEGACEAVQKVLHVEMHQAHEVPDLEQRAKKRAYTPPELHDDVLDVFLILGSRAWRPA